jgi:hypothetical protein
MSRWSNPWRVKAKPWDGSGYLGFNRYYYKNREKFPVDGAPLHRAKNKSSGRNISACGAYLSSMDSKHVAARVTGFVPYGDPPSYTEEERAFRFLAGVKENPEWVYKAPLCKRCFPPANHIQELHSCPTCGHGKRVKADAE